MKLIKSIQLFTTLILILQFFNIISAEFCLDAVDSIDFEKRVITPCRYVKEAKRSISKRKNDKNMFEISGFRCTSNVSDECEKVKSTFEAAGQIISDAFYFNTPVLVNVSFFSFCEELKDCPNNTVHIGAASPKRSILMGDDDDLNRFYPQALVKQFNLESHPEFLPSDITANFNTDVKWYFGGKDPIKKTELELLPVVLHELMHGLGFRSNWGTWVGTEGVIPFPIFSEGSNQTLIFNGFIEYCFDKYLVLLNPDCKDYKPTSLVTKEFNNFSGGPGSKFNNTTEFIIEFKNSTQFNYYGKKMLNITTKPKDYGFQIYAEDALILETSYDPFSQGVSIVHVDQSTYQNSSDFLMKASFRFGETMEQIIKDFGDSKYGPIGPKLRKVMETLGYESKNNPNPYRPSEPKSLGFPLTTVIIEPLDEIHNLPSVSSNILPISNNSLNISTISSSNISSISTTTSNLNLPMVIENNHNHNLHHHLPKSTSYSKHNISSSSTKNIKSLTHDDNSIITTSVPLPLSLSSSSSKNKTNIQQQQQTSPMMEDSFPSSRKYSLRSRTIMIPTPLSSLQQKTYRKISSNPKLHNALAEANELSPLPQNSPILLATDQLLMVVNHLSLLTLPFSSSSPLSGLSHTNLKIGIALPQGKMMEIFKDFLDSNGHNYTVIHESKSINYGKILIDDDKNCERMTLVLFSTGISNENEDLPILDLVIAFDASFIPQIHLWKSRSNINIPIIRLVSKDTIEHALVSKFDLNGVCDKIINWAKGGLIEELTFDMEHSVEKVLCQDGELMQIVEEETSPKSKINNNSNNEIGFKNNIVVERKKPSTNLLRRRIISLEENEIKETIEEWKKKYNELLEKSRKREEIIIQLQQENEKSRKQEEIITQLRQENEKYCVSINKLSSELSIQEQLDEKTQFLSKLKHDLEIKVEENEKLKKDLETSKSSIKSLRSQLKVSSDESSALRFELRTSGVLGKSSSRKSEIVGDQIRLLTGENESLRLQLGEGDETVEDDQNNSFKQTTVPKCPYNFEKCKKSTTENMNEIKLIGNEFKDFSFKD
ncbi:7688_t:CDS:10 [Diversispora eburnea]|uniref:7688_t:CDS:1 n=1 Tax=Diversispora eburnea TaxID=1213867 RepID=A0A9N8VVX1_9GLOM|nr:7688_t:CDS:10 [Diversispora eburnea]